MWSIESRISLKAKVSLPGRSEPAPLRIDMDLINDLGTDLAVAFLVDERYRQKIDPARARALIECVKRLLETPKLGKSDRSSEIDPDCNLTLSAH